MDLEMVGPGGDAGPGVGPVGPPNTSQGVDLLFLRLLLPNWSVGIGWGDWTPIFETPHDGLTVMECEAPDSQMMAGYVGGRRLAILGNNFHDPGQSHVLRVWQAHKAVISNNRLWLPGGTRHSLKLHGPNLTEANRELCPETRWVTVTDNIVHGLQWAVSIGPQDSISDERVSHVVYERNHHFGMLDVVADLETSACQIMIRNNIFDGTSANYYTAILVHQRGIEPVPTDVRIYNNTIYKGDTNNETYAFDIGAEVVDAVVRNNLMSAPAGGGTVTLLVGGGGTGWVYSDNLLTDSPGFTNAAGGDFSLQAGSPAIDAGATLWEVREDFLRVARPRGAAYDVGAFEW